MNFINVLSLLLVGGLLITSCKKDLPAEETQLQIPSSYDGQNFESNAASQLALVQQLIDLSAAMKVGRTSGNVVAKTDLDNLFTVGSPSLADEITNYFQNKIEGTGGWFDELAKASGNNWTPQSPDGMSEGGTFEGYLFDENGVEIEQLIEKGQFGATLYNHATQLMAGNITPATVDQLVAVYGARPAFVNSGSSNASAAVRDRALANYGARRDKNDGNGMYTQLKNEFIKLQTYVKEGPEYNAERDDALAAIKLLWEKINAATVINYCHSPIDKLSQTNPSDSDVSSALHAIAEGIGFIKGFKTINPAYREITDTQIDNILALFNAPHDGTAAVYLFATSPQTELTKLQQVISQLQTIYGFSNQEIEDFKSNWVAVQGR
jgi:hypothetical protein